MKIGTAFDTNLKAKEVTKYAKKFGLENIIVVDTSSIYTWIQVIPKLLMYMAAGILC
jgi:hypothetical protein